MTSYSGGGGGGGGYSGYVPHGERVFSHFLPGEGIARQVIQTDLPRYLGNNCYSKPGNHQGIDGYWYHAYRPLTDAQIQSLRTDSQKFLLEREFMARHNREIPGYELSATFGDSYRINHDGNNPNHPYPSFPSQNPLPPPSSFPPHGARQAPMYLHTATHGAPPVLQSAGGQPVPTNNRNRFDWVQTAEGWRWYDYELGQYAQPPNPSESVPAAVPRPPKNEPPASASEEVDMSSYPGRRQTEPGAGPESTGFYGPGPYYQRNN